MRAGYDQGSPRGKGLVPMRNRWFSTTQECWMEPEGQEYVWLQETCRSCAVLITDRGGNIGAKVTRERSWQRCLETKPALFWSCVLSNHTCFNISMSFAWASGSSFGQPHVVGYWRALKKIWYKLVEINVRSMPLSLTSVRCASWWFGSISVTRYPSERAGVIEQLPIQDLTAQPIIAEELSCSRTLALQQ